MKKISAEQLYEAMEGIGDDLLLRSERAAGKNADRIKTRTIRRISLAVTVAAALVILGIVSTNMLRMGSQGGGSASPAPAEAVVAQSEAADALLQNRQDKKAQETADEQAPAEEAAATESPLAAAAGKERGAEEDAEDMGADAVAESAAQADMEAFFLFEGVRYVETERIPDDGTIAGEYAGTVSKLIDEWSAEEIMESGTGSVTGDLYLVNGRSKEEALCMIEEESKTVLVFEAVK